MKSEIVLKVLLMYANVESLSPSSKLVYEYLKFMESRKIEKAKKMLSNDFLMIFPGSMKFKYLDELINYGKKRQFSVFKTFESFEEIKKNDLSIVYLRGKLFGISLKNKEFNNIRYIDKFTILNNKFIKQEVWNDFAINNLSENNYPLPEKYQTSIEINEIDISISLEVLKFISSFDCKQENLYLSNLDDNFFAILPGNKLLKFQEFSKYLNQERKKSDRKIFEINLMENKNYQVIYLNGTISSIDSGVKKYKNVRFIERIKFDMILKKVLTYEIWNDLSEHGF